MKKFISLVTATVLTTGIFLTNTMPSFAKSFTDLENHKWAVPYISDMSDKGIISGYPDNTFKPANPVTRIEALVMISNLYPEDEIKKVYEENKAEFEPKLQKFDIDKWARPYVTFAVKKGIIPGSDDMLRVLVNDKSKKPINALRYEVAVFVVRGLDMENELDQNATLNYKDNNKINSQAVPFIDLLIKKGVLSSDGDGKGNFNPNKGVTRAEMATIMSNSYKYSPKNNSNKPTTPTTPTDTKTFTLDGKITLVTYHNENITVAFEKSDGQVSNFTNKKNNVVVYKGNTPANQSDIRVGQEAKLVFENGVMTRIVIPQDEKRVSGTLKDINNSENSLSIQINENEIIKYHYTNDTKVMINDKMKEIKDLIPNSEIDIYILDNKITKIVSEISEFEVEGEITKISDNEITITNSDKEDIKVATDANTRYYINGERLENKKSLSVGEKTKATIENGKITRMEIILQKGDFPYSRLDGIEYSTDVTKIKFTDEHGNTRVVNVNRDTVIRMNSSKTSLDELKVGYEISVYTDGINAIEITTNGKYLKTTVTGRVKKIDLMNKEIQIETEDNKNMYLNYNMETIIEDLDGKEIKARDILEGDNVTCIGIIKGGSLELSRLIVDIR